jgi:large repetitive protein
VSLTANPSGLQAGMYTGAVVVSAPNASNPTTTVPVLMTVFAPLQIMTGSLPDAISGVPYNLQLTGTGGTGVFTWVLQKGGNGILPNGLSLDPTTGIISGTPTSTAGPTTLTVVIVLQDSLGHSVPRTFSIVWRPGISISTNQQPTFQFTLGVSYTINSSPFRFQASGGTPPFTWSGTLMPPGLSIDSTTGIVVGTPSTAGTFAASITARDFTGLTSTLSYSFVIVTSALTIENAGKLLPATLVSGTVGLPYDESIMGSGGSLMGYAWTISGAQPPGIVQQRPAGCAPGCGALEFVGTPTRAGSFTFTVSLTDSLNDSTSQSVTLVINSGAPPNILTTTLSLATVGQPYVFSFQASGGAGGYTWSFVGSAPDPALVLSPGGSLSGISSIANDCFSGPGRWVDSQPPFGYFTPQTFQVKVTDAAGSSATGGFCLPSYYPTPHTINVSPANVSFSGPPQTMTVTGINFQSNAMVSINGHGYVNTTFVNSTTLTFLVSPGYSNSELTPGSFTLYVVEPYTYMDSGTATFTIK